MLVRILLLAFLMGALVGIQDCKPVDLGTESAATDTPKDPPIDTTKFTCSGKSSCSAMTSCPEARFYLKNCPFATMDGDGDGIPCEDQWCGH